MSGTSVISRAIRRGVIHDHGGQSCEGAAHISQADGAPRTPIRSAAPETRAYSQPESWTTLTIPNLGLGLHLITTRIADAVSEATRLGSIAADRSGLCTVFLRHTSASLIIQENVDPSARHDLERWLNALLPESGPGTAGFTHISGGPDDMPSHIKAALTASSLSIPIIEGKLALGTWQGIYLWEHRRAAHRREVVVHVGA